MDADRRAVPHAARPAGGRAERGGRSRSPASRPALSTSGGTSDGRFLATLAREVVEFGPLNESIHKIDEHVRIADLEPLSAIYERTIQAIWNRGSG